MKFAWKTAALCCLLTVLFAVGTAESGGTLTLPGNVTAIEEEAFCGLTGVVQIDLPAGVTEIGAGAFRDSGDPSAELRYYFAPSGVSVGAGAFDNCRAVVRLNGTELPRMTYTTGSGGVTITGMSGQPSEVVIPDRIDGKPVVAIGNNVFSGKSALTRVVIPSTVTSIGQNAFRGCSALMGIDLPAGLTSLGSGVFCDCRALTGIILPAGITALPSEAFYGCYALTGIDLTGITSLGSSVFRDCRALTEITIPTSIISLPVSAFEGARGLVQIHLPDTLTAINNYAFYDCRALTEISIPAGVTAIPYGCFTGCSALQSVQLPAGVVSIAQNAFRSCTALTRINFPSGLTSIGQEAFRDACVNQAANAIYVLPDSVETFGSSAFYNCGAGLLAEKGSDMEAFVKTNGYTFAYDADDGFRYQYRKLDNADTLYLTGYKGTGGSVRVPAGPAVIGDSAFEGNTSITAVSIPDGVTKIDRWVFQNCSNLASVTMADSVTEIGDCAFKYCAALTDVEFSASLQRIGSDAFDYACTAAGTQYYVLPDHVTTLNWSPFSDCGAVLCFNRDSETAALFQQNQYIYTYTSETDFRYRWYNNEGTEGHQERLLQYLGSDAVVEIPAYIWLIDDNAFKDNTTLTKVVIPEGVTQINTNAFRDCSNLTDVVFPDSLNKVYDSAFNGCGSAAQDTFLFQLPAGIREMGTYVFYNCPAILVCGLETTTAATISNRGWSFVRKDRESELDLRYKWAYFNHIWSWGLYDYVGPLSSVRLPDDCANVDSAVLRQKVNDGLELVCTQLSDTAAGISRAEINFTFPGHEGVRYRIIDNVLYIMGYAGTGTQIIIPAAQDYVDAGVDEQIRANAFQDQTAITKVVVPEGVTRINDGAFRNCYMLSDIRLPNSLKIFEQCVFVNCGRDAAKPFYLALPDNMEGMTGFSGGNHTFSDFYGILKCGKTSQTAALVTDRSFVYTVEGEEDYRYRYESYTENEVTGRRLWLVGYVGESTTAIIPEGIYGMKLNSSSKLREDWRVFYGNGFNGNETITKVVIPEGTVNIRADVFTGCKNLTDITFPSTLKILDQNVFRYCGMNATEPFYFVLPDNMETMAGRGGGAQTFSDCNAILETGKYSPTAALLTDRNFCYTVAGEHDFRYRYIEYTEGEVTGRRLWLVGYAGEDGTVTIPQGIYGIRNYQWDPPYGSYEPDFYGRGDITSLVIPEGTVVIEDSAFRGCVNLVDITFPESLKVLKNHAFEQCGKNATTLHYYVLPDNMTEISTNVDAGWGAFTDINMGRIVTSPNCSTALLLSGIDTYNHGGSYRFALKGHETDGLLYLYRTYSTDAGPVNRLILMEYEGSDTSVAIPTDCGIWRIENGVFSGQQNLQAVVVPEGVVEIGDNAFDGCTMLHGGTAENVIRLPDTLKTIGNLAFRDLGAAYTSERFFLVLPSSLESFNINIFENCNAVLVAPEGTYAASVLYANWYYYYCTLQDAIAQVNCQSKNDLADPQHVHYGRR